MWNSEIGRFNLYPTLTLMMAFYNLVTCTIPSGRDQCGDDDPVAHQILPPGKVILPAHLVVVTAVPDIAGHAVPLPGGCIQTQQVLAADDATAEDPLGQQISRIVGGGTGQDVGSRLVIVDLYRENNNISIAKY